jgi:hypothetical protein
MADMAEVNLTNLTEVFEKVEKIKKSKTEVQPVNTPTLEEMLWSELEDKIWHKVHEIRTTTIEESIRPLFRYTPDQLLDLSGTPQQVLCQQFLAYIRSTHKLREELTNNKSAFNRAVEAICRAPKYVPKDKSEAK